jgi:hypothetical protein
VFCDLFSAAEAEWRNGRNNGLKIAVLAIFLLCEIDQIEPILRGKSANVANFTAHHRTTRSFQNRGGFDLNQEIGNR